MTTHLTSTEMAIHLAAFDAARDGHTAGLRNYIDAGGSPNLTNDKGDTLLVLASYYQRDDVVALLISAGADVDRVNDNGQTALASAVFRRSEVIVLALLAAGARPDVGRRSALVIADFFGLRAMSALLEAKMRS